MTQRRLRPRELWAAYLETGLIPAQSLIVPIKIAGGLASCGLGVITNRDSVPVTENCSDFNNYNYAESLYGEDYCEGFWHGFDGKKFDFYETEAWNTGYRDGRTCWIHCRERWAALQRQKAVREVVEC